MRKFATPELKRATAAMKSAEKGFFRRCQSADGKKVPTNFESIPGAAFSTTDERASVI
jgi:hypothetical protein